MVPPCSIAAMVGRKPGAADDRGDGDVRPARRRFAQRLPAAGGLDPAAGERLAQFGQAALVGDHRDLGIEFARQRGQLRRAWQFAVSATTRQSSRSRRTRSSVEAPIEPVAPRMEIERVIDQP